MSEPELTSFLYVLSSEDIEEIQRKTSLEAQDKQGRIMPIFRCDPVEVGQMVPFRTFGETDGYAMLPGDFHLYRKIEIARPGYPVLGKVLK